MKLTQKLYAIKTPESIAIVERAISQVANISIEEMRSHRRDRQFAEARMAVWLIVHDYLGYGYMSIAEVYERDHTTIISGVKKMRMDEKTTKKLIDGVQKLCPNVSKRPTIGRVRTVENWQF